MSAAISTRSPANAAHSPFFHGIGTAATDASFAWLPSLIPRAVFGSNAGGSSDAGQEILRGEGLRRPQPSQLFLAAPARRRRRRTQAVRRWALAFSPRRRRGSRCLTDGKRLRRFVRP